MAHPDLAFAHDPPWCKGGEKKRGVDLIVLNKQFYHRKLFKQHRRFDVGRNNKTSEAE